MNIEHNTVDDQLTLAVEGRLDTNTSPELQESVTELLNDDITTVIFDFENLDYISSSGLRVILSVLKLPAKTKRKVVIRKPNERIREILYNVGFEDLVEIVDD